MRTRGMQWAVVLLIVIVGAAWGLGWLAPVKDILRALAAQPDTHDAFRDPHTGRTDALIMLVSFFLLTPFAVFVALLALTFVIIAALLITEPFFRAVHLPTWLCVPLVLAGVAWAAYGVRETWLPPLLYVLGLAARAGLVYFAGTAGMAR
jgi:hypothetical protein